MPADNQNFEDTEDCGYTDDISVRAYAFCYFRRNKAYFGKIYNLENKMKMCRETNPATCSSDIPIVICNC